MATEREAPTTTDYVVTALSPVLIMLMVGSLVYFLVEVLYEGKYSGRLLYTLFFFVFGAVLVARIAIQIDASRASLYGLLLGIVSYVAILTYVEYPKGSSLASFGWLINLVLLLLIWFCAHKLTWDCTHIDEKRKGAGRGILSAAGLDVDAKEESAAPGNEVKKSPKEEEPPTKGKKKKKKKHESKLWDWIDKYQKHREERRKAPHTPGTWVIYFALAALPLFALGQSLVASEDADRRRATFLQMVVYVGSALALLVTTSLLGLRRYLRQRKTKIPVTMTAGWLGLGAILIVVFVGLAAFLPRPHSEVPWFGIARAGKSDRNASKYALNKGSAGKGEGAGGNVSKAGDGNASGKNGKPGGGTKGEKGSGGKGQGGKSGSGKNGKSSGGKDGGKDGKGGSNNEKSDSKSGGSEKKSEDSSSSGSSGDDSERDNKTDSENDADKDEKDADGSGGKEKSTSQLAGAIEKVAEFLKWIVFAIVVILVVIAVALGILRYLAPFTNWAQRLLDALKNWWAGLFGRKTTVVKKEETPALPLGPLRPPPFHEFSNPFVDGSAESRDLADLVAYTFMALDSWAWDQEGGGRGEAETPLEFVARLCESFPDLEEMLRRFAKVYARVSYSESPPPADALKVLESLWEGMVHGVPVG